MSTGRTHMRSLDGVRGLAIATVMLYHGWVYTGDGSFGLAIEQLRSIGWAGVDLFFVLSGFLITGILLETREQPQYWRNFLIRRGLRIFPLYYAVLCALLVGGLVLQRMGLGHVDQSLEHLDNIWVNFTYLTDIWVGTVGEDKAPIDIAWSLAIEEQFYLVFPAVVLYFRRSDRGLVAVLVAMVLLAPVARILTHLHGAQPTLGPYALPHCRMDTLALGALVRLLMHMGHVQIVATLARLAPILIAAALLVLFTWTRKDPRFIVLGYSLTALAAAAGIAALVEAAPRGWSRRAFENGALVYLGKLSYGLYLFHLFARAAVNFALPKLVGPGHGKELWYVAAQLGGMLALTLLVATVSFEIFEKPILKLKDRWAPTKPVAITPSVGGT